MGKGTRNRRKQNCWTYRSTFEKALIISSLLLFVIIVFLVSFLIFQLNFANRNLNSCTNPICQIEAEHLAQRIDPSTNPCNNFYKFSCGSLWKNNNSSTSDPFSTIIRESKEQILQVYNEPVRIADHRIMKAAKSLYQTCLNTTEIQKRDLDYIKTIVSSFGGWPVVLGAQWNESEFWWLDATQSLRRGGLFYGSFIDVSVVPDNKTASKFILKVGLPEPSIGLIRDVKDFVEVATALGAQENSTLQEYEEMYKYSLDVKRELLRRYNDDQPEKYTIAKFQTKYEFINWKQFLNNILGSALKIQDTDPILFDSADGFYQWFNFLSNSSKKDQANFMIWKAIEQLLPFIQNRPDIPENDRPEFCIDQVRNRFVPSPLDVAYVQKHLPENRTALAEGLVNNMKAELLKLLERCDWLDPIEKQKARERLANMRQVVGAPKGWQNREIYHSNVDMDGDDAETHDSFIGNLLRANKNYQSQVYQQIVKGPMSKWSLQTGSLIGDYYWEDNVLNIPATVLQGTIFNEDRPNYVNYGSIGMLLSHHFLRILIGERDRLFDVENITETNTYQIFEERLSKCMDIQLNNTYMVDSILQQSLGFQISYDAYKKSKHATEDVGFGGYTANQLYWLSAASYFCQPDPNITLGNSAEADLFSNLFLSSIASNKNFGDDFHCELDTKMHPKEKCTLF